MKRIMFTLALSLTFPAVCSASLTKVVEKYMAAWNNHDAVLAAGFFADSVEYYDAATGAPIVGKTKAQSDIIEAFLRAVPDLKWTQDTTDTPIEGPDGIAFRWTFSGTNTGPWSDGTKATKKAFSIQGATLMKIRNEKIIFQGDYYDAHALYKQLGLAQ